jgi:hypothetical protein
MVQLSTYQQISRLKKTQLVVWLLRSFTNQEFQRLWMEIRCRFVLSNNLILTANQDLLLIIDTQFLISPLLLITPHPILMPLIEILVQPKTNFLPPSVSLANHQFSRILCNLVDLIKIRFEEWRTFNKKISRFKTVLKCKEKSTIPWFKQPEHSSTRIWLVEFHFKKFPLMRTELGLLDQLVQNQLNPCWVQ